jgi:hypothetical protein
LNPASGIWGVESIVIEQIKTRFQKSGMIHASPKHRRYPMTTEQATALKASLESMFEHIATRQNMMDDLQQIEKLQQEISPTAPPMLRHYLERRSYTKALDFLEAGVVIEDPNRPDCDE